jgi:hypothetical protein
MTRSAGLALSAVAIVSAAVVLTARATGDELPTVEEIFADQRNETTKAEILAEDMLLRELGAQSPVAVPENPEEAGPDPDPADFVWEEGIFPDAEFPIGLGYVFENRWNGRLPGWNVTVYAGAYRDDPSTGVVLIQLKDPETWGNRFAGPFEAPTDGPLTIHSYDGLVLTLADDEGATVLFDVGSRRYVAA